MMDKDNKDPTEEIETFFIMEDIIKEQKKTNQLLEEMLEVVSRIEHQKTAKK